jgi:hypothetical protein
MLKRLVEQGIRGIGERHGLQHASVVDQHVELAELLFGDLEHAAHFVGFRRRRLSQRSLARRAAFSSATSASASFELDA